MEKIIISLKNIVTIGTENTESKDLQLFSYDRVEEVSKNINRTLVNSWLKEKKYNNIVKYIDGVFSKEFNVEHNRDENGVTQIILKPIKLFKEFDLLPLERSYTVEELRNLYSPTMYKEDNYNRFKGLGEKTIYKSLYTMIGNTCDDKGIKILDLDTCQTVKGMIKVHSVLNALATIKQFEQINDNMVNIRNTSDDIYKHLTTNYKSLTYAMLYSFIGELNSHELFKCSKMKAIELIDYLVVVPWETYGMKSAIEYFVEGKFDNDKFLQDVQLHLANCQADQIKKDYRNRLQYILNNKPTHDQINDLAKLYQLLGYNMPYGYIARLGQDTILAELKSLKKEYGQIELKDNSILSLADFSQVELKFNKSKEFEENKKEYVYTESIRDYKRYTQFIRNVLKANGEEVSGSMFDELESKPSEVYLLYLEGLRNKQMNFGEFENLPVNVKRYLVGIDIVLGGEKRA